MLTHLSFLFQMFFHVPEVSLLLQSDAGHRVACQLSQCSRCALFMQQRDLAAKKCSSPSFFIDLWKSKVYCEMRL